MFTPATRCRTARRRPIHTEILMRIGDAAIPLEAVDISATGVYVAMDVLPEEGDTFDLLFNLPDGGLPLRARCAVARVHAERQDPREGRTLRPGVGMEFVEIADRARARLSEFSDGPLSAPRPA